MALQQAAIDDRITAIVAAEVFSDLRTVVAERAPVFTSGSIRRALELAEEQAGLDVDAVSPASAAASVRIPVLLIHGAEDADTPPEHSRRVLAALAGSKRLILVPGAGHNESLSGDAWSEIERWLDRVIPPGQVSASERLRAALDVAFESQSCSTWLDDV